MNENEFRKPATVRTNDMPPKSEEIDWQEVYEQQQAGDGTLQGGFLNNQLAKIGCGCALPALFLLGTCSTLTAQNNYGEVGPAAIGGVAGTIVAGMLLVWAPLFAFWLREQNRWLIGGSFALFAGIFAILGFAKLGNGYQALKDDVGAISEVKFDKDGNPILTPGMAGKGPMSKLMFDMAKEQEAIRNGFDAEVTKSGIPDMMLANRVERNPSLVQNCGRIPALAATIEAYRKRNLALIESGPKRIDALDISYATKADMKRGAVDRMETNLRMVNAQWDLQAKTLDPIHRTCLLLSKRNWKAQGELYAFYSQSDIRTFDAAMQEIDQVNAEINALTKKRMDDVRAGQDRIREQIRR